jgi:septum formation protein
MKQRIILATGSPTRRKIAERTGLKFDFIPSKYVEDMSLNLPPEELAMELAYGKAEDVAKDLSEGIVLGIDTFAYFNGQVIGKPEDKEDAFKMLKGFSNNVHLVYSGICLIDCKTKKIIKDFDLTRVKFRDLDDSEINRYVESGESLNKAASYAIQENGDVLIERVEGCYLNIAGFPFNKIVDGLKKLGVNVFE